VVFPVLSLMLHAALRRNEMKMEQEKVLRDNHNDDKFEKKHTPI